MESLSNDVLCLILQRVSDGSDRKSCSEVCTLWLMIEAQTRTRIRVLDPRRLPYFLLRFPNLTTLVAHDLMTDQALMFVGEFCPNLQTLDLQSRETSYFRWPFGDEGLIAAARGCRHLKEVSLSSTNVSDKGIIMALQTYAKDLAVLKLSYCDSITDTSLEAIGNMESIFELLIENCPLITDNGLNLLSSGPVSRSLRVLTVSYCELTTDVGILYLRRMSRLEELDLSDYLELTEVGGAAVSAISSLKKLDFSWQDVTDETLFVLARGCRNLVDINLTGCNKITGRGLVSLASSLTLEMIDLSFLKKCRELNSYHVVQIVKGCPSLKHMIVDKELKKGISRSHWKKLRGSLCRLEWV